MRLRHPEIVAQSKASEKRKAVNIEWADVAIVSFSFFFFHSLRAQVGSMYHGA